MTSQPHWALEHSGGCQEASGSFSLMLGCFWLGLLSQCLPSGISINDASTPLIRRNVCVCFLFLEGETALFAEFLQGPWLQPGGEESWEGQASTGSLAHLPTSLPEPTSALSHSPCCAPLLGKAVRESLLCLPPRLQGQEAKMFSPW